MFKILSTYICLKKIYKIQHLVGSGTPVLYIGRTVLEGKSWSIVIECPTYEVLLMGNLNFSACVMKNVNIILSESEKNY
jgi:hypothetical protein